MTNNKQQTAVEWLVEQFEKYYVFRDLKNTIVYQQAKAMEKEQMIKFAMHLHDVDMSLTGTDILMQEADQYYEQTYGGGEQ